MKCGREHTICLTKDGGVWSFGASDYGQLGQGKKEKEMSPRQIVELMGTEVSQVLMNIKFKKTRVYLRILRYTYFLNFRSSAEIVTPWLLSHLGSGFTPSAWEDPGNLGEIIRRMRTRHKLLSGRGCKKSKKIKKFTLSELEVKRFLKLLCCYRCSNFFYCYS